TGCAQPASSLPRRGCELPFFFSFALALFADEARYAGSASLIGTEGLWRLTLLDTLAYSPREEDDGSAEPKAALAGPHRSGQELAGISRQGFTDVCRASAGRLLNPPPLIAGKRFLSAMLHSVRDRQPSLTWFSVVYTLTS